MAFAGSFVRLAQSCLPMPFTIAILLTLATMLAAGLLTRPADVMPLEYGLRILGFWEAGFWHLLEFAMQMMLMLVLGHVLALTRPVDSLIQQVVRFCTSTPRAVALVTLCTITVALFNWGLGLIFGAIFARKVGESALKNGYALNYPMVGAAGYSGMMVWHGGLSGSAPLKIAEPGHFLTTLTGRVPMSETVFSVMNISITLGLLLVVPLAMAWLARQVEASPAMMLKSRLGTGEFSQNEQAPPKTPAESLDQSTLLARGFGLLILGVLFYSAVIRPNTFDLAFLTPNFINFLLLGLGIFLYGNLRAYAAAVEGAIAGAAGIMIQFPLYAGIAGIMQHAGLIHMFSAWIVQVSTPITYPLWTMVSAGLVNMFVPSGGGQWAVQGPMIAEAANRIGVPMSKAVMALAYGDQLTNMLQPFWALPLLGITRLAAQEILPYTLYLMLVGGAIYTLGLLIF